jgi:hypothetical protein
LVRESPYDALRHHVADGRRIRILTIRDPAERKVTVGHNADQTIFLADGERPYVQLTHEPCRFHQVIVGPNATRVSGHDFVNFHARSL